MGRWYGHNARYRGLGNVVGEVEGAVTKMSGLVGGRSGVSV